MKFEEATWELEEEMRMNYLDLFTSPGENFKDEILLRGRGCDNPKNYFSHLPTICNFI